MLDAPTVSHSSPVNHVSTTLELHLSLVQLLHSLDGHEEAATEQLINVHVVDALHQLDIQLAQITLRINYFVESIALLTTLSLAVRHLWLLLALLAFVGEDHGVLFARAL